MLSSPFGKKGTGKRKQKPSFLPVPFLFLLIFSPQTIFATELVDRLHSERASSAMAVTADPYATEAAAKIIQEGGNAVDAAIAAQWVLNVVEPQSSGIGGGGFFVYYNAKTKAIHTYDGREKAPLRAFPAMFLDDRKEPLRFYPDRVTGGLPVGVPGTLKLLKEVHRRFGSKKFRFESLFDPAIRLAEEGVPASKRLAAAIEEEAPRLKLFAASRELYFHGDGTPVRAGELFFQKDLARTFRTLARDGTGSFYEGEIARSIVKEVRYAPFHPGLMELGDLEFYDVVEREALHGNYRGYDIFTIGPPSSGGVALIEILNILENFSLIFYGPSADSYHLAIEAQKISFEDRAHYLGDPDFSKIPLKKILSKDYARKKAKEIKFDEAKPVGALVEEASLPLPGNTSHLSIRDAEGNLVSYTTTIEHVFGSAMTVSGWGFVLNNELTDFDAEPRSSAGVGAVIPKGHIFDSVLPEEVKGKVSPNAPGPEKRPRSSMCPVILFRNGEPFLIAGSPGGSLIIPIVQEILMNLIDFKMPLEEAMAAPRFAARTDYVEAESEFFKDEKMIQALKNRGHWLKTRPPFGNAQAVLCDPENNTYLGVSDPRGEGDPAGF